MKCCLLRCASTPFRDEAVGGIEEPERCSAWSMAPQTPRALPAEGVMNCVSRWRKKGRMKAGQIFLILVLLRSSLMCTCGLTCSFGCSFTVMEFKINAAVAYLAQTRWL